MRFPNSSCAAPSWRTTLARKQREASTAFKLCQRVRPQQLSRVRKEEEPQKNVREKKVMEVVGTCYKLLLARAAVFWGSGSVSYLALDHACAASFGAPN